MAYAGEVRIKFISWLPFYWAQQLPPTSQNDTGKWPCFRYNWLCACGHIWIQLTTICYIADIYHPFTVGVMYQKMAHCQRFSSCGCSVGFCTSHINYILLSDICQNCYLKGVAHCNHTGIMKSRISLCGGTSDTCECTGTSICFGSSFNSMWKKLHN